MVNGYIRHNKKTLVVPEEVMMDLDKNTKDKFVRSVTELISRYKELSKYHMAPKSYIKWFSETSGIKEEMLAKFIPMTYCSIEGVGLHSFFDKQKDDYSLCEFLIEDGNNEQYSGVIIYEHFPAFITDEFRKKQLSIAKNDGGSKYDLEFRVMRENQNYGDYGVLGKTLLVHSIAKNGDGQEGLVLSESSSFYIGGFDKKI